MLKSTRIILNTIVIEARADMYVNATQLCKAGGKKFSNWYQQSGNKELIESLESELNAVIPVLNTEPDVKSNAVITALKAVDVQVGGNHAGSWIHPDLAVQLAQWAVPTFAIRVSRWVRELATTGSVSIDSRKSDEELKAMRDEMNLLRLENEEAKSLLESKDELIAAKDGQINRLHDTQIELIQFKKRITKEETLYIVSTANYARQGIFKIGRTAGKMSFRSSSHNTTHIQGDKVKVIKEFKVNDATIVERNVHYRLNSLLVAGEREFFLCPYDLLESLVELVVRNDDSENELMNQIIDAVYKIKQHVFNESEWLKGVPPNLFNENTAPIPADDIKLPDLDQSNWTSNQKGDFALSCLLEYIEIECQANPKFQVIWTAFQKFFIDRLNIPKSKFKSSEWKEIVKDYAKKHNINVKWKATHVKTESAP